MPPSSYRLDTIGAQLIERLEGTRRAWMDRPSSAEEAVPRLAAEAAHAWARECRETIGDEAQAARIERELEEVFVPRYIRLAVHQNRLEARGYGIAASNVFSRVAFTAAAFLLAELLLRVIREPFGFPLLALPILAFLFPEVRTAWLRRQHNNRLQELVDDLARVQDAVEKLPGIEEKH